MVSFSITAVLLWFGFVAQAGGPTGDWVVIESKDGPFSFAVPARPVEQSGEAEVPNGKMRWKIYTYERGEDVLIFRQQVFPKGGPQDSPLRAFDRMETAAKQNGETVSKVPITVHGVSGIELVTKDESTTGKSKELVRVRILEQGPTVYFVLARSGPGKPLPQEAARFFDSLRFDGKPATAKPTAPTAMTKAPAPARRKQIGKINRDDRTADAALRTFLMAMQAGDEDTLREVTLPNADFDWLLRGEIAHARELSKLKQHVINARVERLKQGDRVQITAKEVHVILPTEVGRDRGALKILGAPAYAPMQLVKGRWKVDPAPIIAACKAAAGAE
jgi:hypothetical protein